MAKDKISDYSSTANSNTDIAGINIDEGCAPSGINDAIRTLMAQLKNFQTGTGGDSFNGPVGSTTASTGAFTTLSATGVASFAAGSASAPALTRTGDTNTGIFFPAADTIAFAEGGTEAMRLDSSGNMGLGVTPSAWDSSVFRSLQTGTGAGSASLSGRSDGGKDMVLGSNLYYGTSSFRYVGTGTATMYRMDGATHAWSYAASGTAGNAITFTQAMTLDASGRLTVGYTSAANAEKLGTNGTVISTGQSINSFSYDQAGFDYNSSTKEGRFFSTASGGAGFLTFYTASGSERARIDSSGTLLINATSKVSSTTYFSVQGAAGSSNISEWKDTSTTYGSGNYIQVYWNSTNGVAGGVAHTAATTVAFNTSSDIRLKENIVDAPSVLNKVLAAKVRSYDWKDDKHHVEYGFVAQELYQHLPEAVGKGDDTDEITDPKGTWQVEYGRLTPMLVKAIQEQQAIITQLQADVAALKG